MISFLRENFVLSPTDNIISCFHVITSEYCSLNLHQNLFVDFETKTIFFSYQCFLSLSSSYQFPAFPWSWSIWFDLPLFEALPHYFWPFFLITIRLQKIFLSVLLIRIMRADYIEICATKPPKILLLLSSDLILISGASDHW